MPATDLGQQNRPDVATVLPLLKKYLLRAVPAILDCDEVDKLDDAVSNPDTQEILSLFATDQASPSLIVQKYLPLSSNDGEVNGDNAFYVISLQLKQDKSLSSSAHSVTSLAFIKNKPFLTSTESVGSQVQMVQLNSESPYDTLLHYVRHCLLPYSRTTASDADHSSSSATALSSSNTASSVSRKLGELEQELLRATHSTDVPTPLLELPSPIAAAVSKALETVPAGSAALPPVDAVPAHADPAFLSQLQQSVHAWRRAIHVVSATLWPLPSQYQSHLYTLPAGATAPNPPLAAQEALFWASKSRALARAQAALDSPVVRYVFAILQTHKRHMNTLSLAADSGLSASVEQASVIAEYLRGLDFAPITSAASPTALTVAVQTLFTQLRGVRRSHYPAARLLAFLRAISNDVAHSLLFLLRRALAGLSSSSPSAASVAALLTSLLADATTLYNTWHRAADALQRDVLDSARRKQDAALGDLLLAANAPYDGLSLVFGRLSEVKKVVCEHAQLHAVVRSIGSSSASGPASGTAVTAAAVQRRVQHAFAALYQSGVLLDVDPARADAYAALLRAHADAVADTEAALESLLHAELIRAGDDTEALFAVCARFSPVFSRPRVAAALHGHRSRLLEVVRAELDDIQAKLALTRREGVSEASLAARVHGLSPLSAQATVQAALRRKVQVCLQRTDSLLGLVGRDTHEGAAIYKQIDLLLTRTSLDSVTEPWVRQFLQLSALNQQEPVLCMVPVASSAAPQHTLALNHDPRLDTLFQEAATFAGLGVPLPFEVGEACRDVRARQPHLHRLRAVLATMASVAAAADRHPWVKLLIAHSHRKVQKQLESLCAMRWRSTRLAATVAALTTLASEVAGEVAALEDAVERIEALCSELQCCGASAESWCAVVEQVRAVVESVDGMLPAGYANMVEFVALLNAKIAEILAGNLAQVLSAWAVALPLQFTTTPKHASLEHLILGDQHTGKMGKNGKLQISLPDLAFSAPSTHVLAIVEGSLSVHPPLAHALAAMRREMDRWLRPLAALPQLSCHAHTALLASHALASTGTFLIAVDALPPTIMAECVAAMRGVYTAARDAVDGWRGNQALWDVSAAAISAQLGEDLAQWQQLLIELRSALWALQGDDTLRHGPILLDAEAMRARAVSRFQTLRGEVQDAAAEVCQRVLLAIRDDVRSGRRALEAAQVDVTNTDDLVAALGVLQTSSESASVWGAQLEAARGIETLLQRGKVSLPAGWVPAQTIGTELSYFSQIQARRQARLASSSPAIIAKLAAEESESDARVRAFADEWAANRPVDGSVPYAAVVEVLARFEGRAKALVGSLQTLEAAKRALGLSGSVQLDESLRVATAAASEVDAIKGVWAVLGVFHRQLDVLAATAVRGCNPIDVRRELHDLQQRLTAVPADVRSFRAYDALKAVISERVERQVLLTDICSGFLRLKHQRMLLGCLGLQSLSWAELTVGHLWQVKQFSQVLKAVRVVLEQAQGESALEEFIAGELSAKWGACVLDTVQYQGKAFLVRNWAALLEMAVGHLGDVSAMKQSPYFAAFEREAMQWEAFLTHAVSVIEAFLEVQRRWVYLEGIFCNSSDVQTQLVAQYRRFKAFDRDFTTLTRDIKADPRAQLWLGTDKGLAGHLGRELEALEQVQKALGEYLESQRQTFPRFYFVGDEDLLEIVGNAANPHKVLRHLPKMFAGIASLEIVDGDVIAMLSAEGERVPLSAAVNISKASSVQAWLSALDKGMQHTLYTLLVAACDRLAAVAGDAPGDVPSLLHGDDHAAPGAAVRAPLLEWVEAFPAQVALLAIQADWTTAVDAALHPAAKGRDGAAVGETNARLGALLTRCNARLQLLSGEARNPALPAAMRCKLEQLITEMVYHRDTLRDLTGDARDAADSTCFDWLKHPRFYLDRQAQTLQVRVSRAAFTYGFEYLGVTEKLVQTPLTTRAFLSLAEALHLRQGANPFGPAGTGKTETVKAFGALLGRFVLVFNCDESFDLAAMSRIFVGLCECGAWGCFDEFNRLKERILSAVSQQILAIQTGLQRRDATVALSGKTARLHPAVGLFVTMNPGYAGRSNLPDNLKALFRPIAMIKPSVVLISQVMLFAQGFVEAEALSSRLVLLFTLCAQQVSEQSHYDFGLRALKAVLRSAGSLRRRAPAALAVTDDAGGVPAADTASATPTAGAAGRAGEGANIAAELDILLQALCTALVPKLVQADVVLFQSLLGAVFPNAKPASLASPELITAICSSIAAHSGCAAAGGAGANRANGSAAPSGAAMCSGSRKSALQYLVPTPAWVAKIAQLHALLHVNHAVMLVGAAGTGKTTALHTLQHALTSMRGNGPDAGADGDGEGESQRVVIHTMDPKAITKEELFGRLDSTTMEWTDGLFTHTLRKIVANEHGEMRHRHWVVFDGDVDPEWAENLNSVLDDNRLLSLPTGERLPLPPNINIIFECRNLVHATPATVSRCGMVWFAQEALPIAAVAFNKLCGLAVAAPALLPNAASNARQQPLRAQALAATVPLLLGRYAATAMASVLSTGAVAFPAPCLDADAETVLSRCYELMASTPRVMDGGRDCYLTTIAALLSSAQNKLLAHAETHPVPALTPAQVARYMQQACVYALLWAAGGAMALKHREAFAVSLAQIVRESGHADLLPNTLGNRSPTGVASTLFDFDVVLTTSGSAWELVEDRLQPLDLPPAAVVSADQVISTADTVRHADVITSWLDARMSVLLCGPPGSGKSMTLTSVMRAQPHVDLVTLNFSSTTAPAVLLKTLAVNTVTERSAGGLVMRPSQPGRWLVVFCDEINLPAADAYETQSVAALIRQLVEHGGYWRTSDYQFVALERIQLIGACNPPTDAGRVPICPRLLRHMPLLFVDFPSHSSLVTIYGAFTSALLKLAPAPVRVLSSALTAAMVAIYERAQATFTADQHPHYIYSPRELSRWVRALYEALVGCSAAGSTPSVDYVVRLVAHEALRLFSDRLVTPSERAVMDTIIDDTLRQHVPSASAAALARPMLLCNWLTPQISSVDRESLREFISHRLRVFGEEEMEVKIVLFDEVLEHILRIDRILKQPLGHALLVGTSGSGKTMLSRFVAWLNNMTAFQIKVHRHYSAADFDKDLRSLLMRAGVHGEKICFIFDESNAVSTAFLERMNCLLASGDVPGLFEGPDYAALLADCKDQARKADWPMPASAAPAAVEAALYRTFVSNVQRNLHVVFTMNPADKDFDNRAATSPALFNRCVTNWMGEWSSGALAQVANEYLKAVDIASLVEYAHHLVEVDGEESLRGLEESRVREGLVSLLVHVHEGVGALCRRVAKRQQGRTTYVTPRHFLDVIGQYKALFEARQEHLREQLRHLNAGLRKLVDTREEVVVLQGSLQEQQVLLTGKEREAHAQLEQMLLSRQRAEEKQAEAVKIAAEVKSKGEAIAQRKHTVTVSLDQVMPAVLEAKQSVSGINKADLDQVTRFTNPPTLVRSMMECVCLIMGEKTKDWNEMKTFMRRGDFIKNVLNFDLDSLPVRTRHTVEKEYLSQAEFTVDRMTQASRACGPLLQWAKSLCLYSSIKDSVAPLTRELQGLEAEQAVQEQQLREVEELLVTLQQQLEQYKQEYGALVQEAHVLKHTIEEISTRVGRSVKLLESLAMERGRWQSDQVTYKLETVRAVGDCAIVAAAVAYSGYFTQQDREALVDAWTTHLQEAGVPFSPGVSVVSLLSTPAQQLQWHAMGLPNDPLSVENAVLLQQCRRCPLVIDPTGQAVAFLRKQAQQRAEANGGRGQLLVTSLLDGGFLKHLEAALRFGNTLLVEDVENIDPVLNSVLNNEITRTGGRVMITVGDKQIDLSPSFKLVLATRDASVHFTPDLCSRVTLVNFTVTPASLAAQCLGRILRTECPSVEVRRRELLQLQGEFRAQLRSQEESLLAQLSAVEGAILDSDVVLTALEQLKQDATDTQQRLLELDAVMQSVGMISEIYEPLANAAARMHFCIERFSNVHELYQTSLPRFLDTLHRVLANPLPLSSDATADAAEAKDAGDDALATQTMQLTGCLPHFFDSALFMNVAADTRQGSPVADADVDVSAEVASLLQRKPTQPTDVSATGRSFAAILAPLATLLFARNARGMYHVHARALALRLCQILLDTLAPARPASPLVVTHAHAHVHGAGTDAEASPFGGVGGDSGSDNDSDDEAVLPTHPALAQALPAALAAPSLSADKALLNLLLLDNTPNTAPSGPVAAAAALQLDARATALLNALAQCPTTAAVPAAIAASPAAWLAFTRGGHMPSNWHHRALPRVLQLLGAAAICKALRPGRLSAALDAVTAEGLGASFVSHNAHAHAGLEHVVFHEVTCHTPLLLIAEAGYDASTKVDAMAAAHPHIRYSSLAMGAPECFGQAEQLLASAAAKGHWLLLRNVHVVTEWLGEFEKKLHHLVPHPDFRLFLSAEATGSLPSQLTRRACVLLSESPKGLKHSLERTLTAATKAGDNAAMGAPPIERARAHFLVHWLHAVVIERRSFVPIGWVKAYEFSESDLTAALASVDAWIDHVAAGRQNIAPRALPWHAIRSVLSQCVYGARVDNPNDQRWLDALLTHLFSPEAYEHAAPLCFAMQPDGTRTPLLTCPDGNTPAHMLAWAKALPESLSAEALGLAPDADVLLLERVGAAVCACAAAVQTDDLFDAVSDEADAAADATESADVTATAQAVDSSASRRSTLAGLSGWKLALASSALEWSTALTAAMSTAAAVDPSALHSVLALLRADGTAAATGSGPSVWETRAQHPVWRALGREAIQCYTAVQLLLSDLDMLVQVLRGDARADATLRNVLAMLQRGMVPVSWRKATDSAASAPGGLVAHLCDAWVSLARALVHFQPEQGWAGLPRVWVSALRSPQALLMASKQVAAKAMGASVEDLRMLVAVVPAGERCEATCSDVQCVLSGVVLRGCKVAQDNIVRITVNNERHALSALVIEWALAPRQGRHVSLPVYRGAARGDSVAEISVRVEEGAADEGVWCMRGVAVTLDGVDTV